MGFQKIFEVEDSDLKQITWEDMIDEKETLLNGLLIINYILNILDFILE